MMLMLTREQVRAMFGVPQMRAVSVYIVCLYDGDGGPEDYVWRTAVFSTVERATSWAKTQGCVYMIDEMVLDEPMYGGWEAVN